MKLLGSTAYLSWEDIVEALAADYEVKIPEGAKKLRFDTEALEMAKTYLDDSGIEPGDYEV
jgi:hypothetical protein